ASAPAPATATTTAEAAPVAPAPPPTVPADTVTGTAGPVPVPGAALNLCVRTAVLTCSGTAAATTVSLTAFATTTPGAATPPAIVTGVCSNGQGVALVITSGSAATTITGAATLTVNGTATVIPVSVPPTAPDQTVLISACVAPGIGLPGSVTGGTGQPASAPIGTLVGGLFQLVLGLLGAPSTSGTPAP
ncbi:MAG: hypothetical protein M3326_14610, partial [Actinomycetota bacterium]|nr:hypothetical protein [Actinomycetota bacterium]